MVVSHILPYPRVPKSTKSRAGNIEDRYQQVANQVNRPIDEVWTMAKEFQECFDNEHEKLRLTGECDEWTYDVWVNRVRTSEDI